MAMEHFNNRDSSVVPELGTDPLMENCSVYFPIDDMDAADTTTLPNQVSRFIMNYPKSHDRCAIFGPFYDEPALEAGVISYGLNVPVITHGAEDNRFAMERQFPNVFRTNVHLHAMGDLAISALRSKGRTDFLNVIYSTHPYSIQHSETINNAAKEQGFKRIYHHGIAPPYVGMEPGRSAWYAMENVKKNTFRTIFVALHDAIEQISFVADAAEEYGLISPDYVWMFSGNIDFDYALYGSGNSNVTKLLKGAAFMRQMDGFDVDPEGDHFLKSWKSQDAETVATVQGLNPILADEPGYYNPPEDYFQVITPMRGSGFMYDAVIAQGMGACWAEANFVAGGGGNNQKRRTQEEADTKSSLAAVEGDKTGNEEVGGGKSNGRIAARGGTRRAQYLRPSSSARSPASTKVVPADSSHQGRTLKEVKYSRKPNMVGISEITFTGATGKVQFKESKRYYKNRNRRVFTYGLYNIQEVQEDEGSSLKYILTDILTEGGAEEGTWEETENGPFIFASGTSRPPELLRAVPEQNYLSRGVRFTGLFFMSIALATIFAAVVFVALKSKHSLVRGAQPMFLNAFAFGATTMTLSIFTLSWDESYGWSEDQLTAACQTTPWLVVLGYIIIYCSLFSKLWRINQILQFRRSRKVDAKAVLGPFAALMLCAVVVLSVWTGVDPRTWHREEIDDYTGETYGSCRSDHSIAFLIPLACIMVLSTILAAFMSWKTKDIQERFSESSWIFYTIFTQLQVLLVGIPVVVILDGASTDAAYLGKTLVIWTVPMSTVLLLIGPKAVKVFFPEEKVSKSRASRGVSMAPGGVTVSGMSPSAANSLFSANSSVMSKGNNNSSYKSRGPMDHIKQGRTGSVAGSTDVTIPTSTHGSDTSVHRKKSSVKFQKDMGSNDLPCEEVIQPGLDGTMRTQEEEQCPKPGNDAEESKEEVQ
mmetsp:Transcript_61869/g.182703  ORF Transcript_61869/g.182703 Transcript_61869/m.182703 type:complete len:932 (-) Transcript_61869:342-3137(-)